ncbi:MAG: hypothetical protein KDD42_09295, partial [Bdellovibrionales bacterium]|nr:hypothetical protein [Bdellovibrionales bacterium]
FVPCIAILAASYLVRIAHTAPYQKLSVAVVNVFLVGLIGWRAALLHRHFQRYSLSVDQYLNTKTIPQFFHSGVPITYVEHLPTYHCYYEDTCESYSRLFFLMYPDTRIFPLSPRPKPFTQR